MVPMPWFLAVLLAAFFLVTSPALAQEGVAPVPLPNAQPISLRPQQRPGYQPRAAWDFHPKGRLWTRSTMAAIRGHGAPLIETVPDDIDAWCPAYAQNGPTQRAAFWTGLISALVRHESTYRPRAVGGGGRWYGLTQILPATARGYGCRAQTGEALRHGASNLSCAVRIMAFTVARDGVVALRDGRSAGVGADWGPMTKRAKRQQMAAYTRRQTYCRELSSVRPVARPATGLTR